MNEADSVLGAPGRATPRELARSGRGAHLPPNRRAGARGASTKEQGKYWHDTAAPPSRGVARGGAKDPTDDPAELDGTCEREGVQRAPQEIG
jgi:hypothetical protein